ncbi:MAG: NAD(P)H-dependent oxidoreductase [bacterium]
MHVLHVIANPKPAAEANSKALSASFFKALKAKQPGVSVTELDLYANHPPFYDYSTYRHYWYPVFDAGYKPTDEEKAAVQYARKQCELFKQADVLVITTPMWNFGMPAILKAWLDQVLMPNVTFTIGAGGVKALHKIRKVIVMVSSGGTYEPGDLRDGIRNGIKAAMGFVGITDVEVAWAQGQNPFFFKDHAERKAKAVAEAAALGTKVAEA